MLVVASMSARGKGVRLVDYTGESLSASEIEVRYPKGMWVLIVLPFHPIFLLIQPFLAVLVPPLMLPGVLPSQTRSS